jgi:TonB-dependent SusC/RagA subfamily outer membrane receptor
MTSSPSRVASVGLLVGCVAACAHGGNRAAQPVDAAAPVLTADDISRTPGEPIEELLMSRFPGVTVTRTPDGGIAVHIRGATSIHGNSEPLYVLDGVTVQPGPNGGLAGLNPYDIAFIQVLKDAVSMVTYGGQAANGVIIIATKRPPH